ncbi:MAG: hypothetical protein PHN84_15345 [Desulfuromonadaceae bacterium]|nr:hypothetical protein [Desulfuromonadaceae bacterium]MDD2855550.1 hypothetical protein [Desulfuromonadaceae bacterium]
MKKVLVVSLAAAISLCTVAVSFAETSESATKEKTVAQTVKKRSAKAKMMPAPEVQLQRLSKGLGLTKEQKDLIKPLLQAEYATLKEIRHDENLSPKQIQTKVESLRTETVTKIQAVLTPEQVEKYNMVSDEIKSNKQMRMKENRNERLGTKGDPPSVQPKKQ